MMSSADKLDKKGIISGLIHYAITVGPVIMALPAITPAAAGGAVAAALGTTASVTAGTALGSATIDLGLKVWESYSSTPPDLTDSDMERCLGHAKAAFEKTLKELDMTDIKREYRGKLKNCLNSTLASGIMAWDKYEYLKKYEDRNTKPDGVIQNEILAVLDACNREEDGELFGTQEYQIDKMHAMSRELTRVFFKTLSELIRADHELYSRLGMERVIEQIEVIRGQLSELAKNDKDIEEILHSLENYHNELNSQLSFIRNNMITRAHFDKRMDQVEDKIQQGFCGAVSPKTDFERDNDSSYAENTAADGLVGALDFRKVRKLDDNLYVNWETGVLASDYRSALSGTFVDDDDKPLSREELRILSILVQGEGALVSWKELNERRKVEDDLRKRFSRFELEGNDSEAGSESNELYDGEVLEVDEEDEDYYDQEDEDYHDLSDEGEIWDSSDTDEEDYFDLDDEEYESEDTVTDDDEKLKVVLEALFSSHTELRNVIMLDDQGRGCRIKQLLESDNDWDDFKTGANKDWKSYRTTKATAKSGEAENSYIDTERWLRWYYGKTCDSFEKNITSASSSGKEVFGDYKMVDVYSNAYATEADLYESYEATEDDEEENVGNYDEEQAGKKFMPDDEYEDEIDREEDVYVGEYERRGNADDTNINSEIMLDYVEKWFLKTEDIERDALSGQSGQDTPSGISFGRVLVLHGQPGDGKTTFCKKAVYAHCKEGWLHAAKQVLWLRLNPVYSRIIDKDKLELSKILCLNDDNKMRSYLCYDEAEEMKESLIILDGYDECCEKLRAACDGMDIVEFCKKVGSIAGTNQWNVIVTSRTMCIKEELESLRKCEDADIRTASFAPMNFEQQDAMIGRMIELDAAKNRRNMNNRVRKTVVKGEGKSGTASRPDKEPLEDYQKNTLPLLRKKKNLRELLKIPALFRMIITMRFNDSNDAKTFGDFYGDLFHQLLRHRGIGSKKEKEYIRDYEEIAARVFYHGGDTCPFGRGEEDKKRELLYIFLTDNKNKEGRLGFLHKSFYQYFLARFIASEIQMIGDDGLWENEKDRAKEFKKLLSILSVERLGETFIWSLVAQVIRPLPYPRLNKTSVKTMGKPTAQDTVERSDSETVDKVKISVSHIREVMERLNNEKSIAAVISAGLKGRTFKPADPIDDKNSMSAIEAADRAENAVFNLVSACAAAEKGLCTNYAKAYRRTKAAETRKALKIKEKEKRIAYGTLASRTPAYGKNALEKPTINERNKKEDGSFANVFRLLRMGDYAGIFMEGMNLDGCDLTGARLDGAYMRGASFEGACLNRASLHRAHLEGATMTAAGLVRAYMAGANMKDAVLINTDLRWADLTGTIMKNAVLDSALLDRANLYGAKLHYASIRNVTEAKNVNFNEAQLCGAHMEGSVIKNSYLIHANLQGAYLEGSDGTKSAVIASSHLEKAELTDARLRGANLQWSYLDGAYCKGTDLREAKLDEASLKDAYLEGAKLAEASLSGTNLDGCVMTEEQVVEIGFSNKQDDGKGTVFFGKPITIEGRIRELCEQIRNGKEKVFFGRYRQGAKGEIEPLCWRVLEVRDDRALLITDKLVDCHMYHDCIYRDWRVHVCWKECALREWLNNDFLKAVFNGSEKARIIKEDIHNPANPKHGTPGCEETPDRLFCLSIDEAKRYFKDDDDRMAALTPYSIGRGSYTFVDSTLTNGEETGWWWLRSPGIDSNDAAYVSTLGDVIEFGDIVVNSGASVRPAFWLNLESEIF